MPPAKERPTGLTEDTGWQVGARQTMSIPLERAWRLLTSPPGVQAWLGEAINMDWNLGASYRLSDGSTGEICIFKPKSHLRLTWHPPGWPRPSTIQVRVIPSGDRTVVAFHQEHIPDQASRAARKLHFQAALAAITKLAGFT